MKNKKNIYFCGIGGISMSAIAQLMISKGFSVEGSDERCTDMVSKLMSKGIKINIGQYAENIDGTIDIFVYTSAISDDNEEIMKAKELGIDIYSRAEFLGKIMKNYKHAVAVSGAHGKTTVTGMLSSVFVHANTDPTIFLGGEMDLLGGNIRIGEGDIFLTEACEYKRNFLNFKPNISVVVNIDEDHLDYYKDLADIESAFVEFIEKLPADGVAIINYEYRDVFRKIDKNVEILTFGMNEEADIFGKLIELSPRPKFEVYYKNEYLYTQEMKVFGEHNIMNALSAIGVAINASIEIDAIKNGLAEFIGTKRRFEYRGEFEGITIIDDYAHHPNEIKTSLKTAHNHCDGKIITVFQSHTYTRTYELLDKFAEVFADSDIAIFTPIYAAREENTGLVSGKILAEKAKINNENSFYADSFEYAKDLALKHAEAGDMIILMGAGEQNKIADMILAN